MEREKEIIKNINKIIYGLTELQVIYFDNNLIFNDLTTILLRVCSLVDSIKENERID